MMSTILTEIEAILFDIDGTLSNSDDEIIEEISYRLHFLQFLWGEQKIKKFARSLVSIGMFNFNILYHWIDRMGIDNFFAKTFPHKKNLGHQGFEKDHSLIDGVKEMLLELQGSYHLAIVSVRSEQGVERFLQQFSLHSFFEVKVSAQTCYYTKPFPQPLLYAAEKMQVDPAHCLMVGDTAVDILAGKAAGMKTIAVLSGFGTIKELRKVGSDHILASAPDLLPLLR